MPSPRVLCHMADLVFVSDLLGRRHPDVMAGLVSAIPRSLRTIPGTADVWCRDFMPVPVGPGRLVQFRYAPRYLRGFPHLRTVCAGRLAGLHGYRRSRLVVDGGNVVRHGGTAVVTDRIYRENRRIERPPLRERLRRELEVDRLIVIPEEPGDSLGHADGVLRLVDDRTALLNDYRRAIPAYARRLDELLRRHGLALTRCPYAPSDDVGRDGVPSARGVYVNFVQVAHTIVCPAYGLREDDRALAVLARCFPRHRIVPLRCDALAAEGGALHCVTWNLVDPGALGVRIGAATRNPA